MRVISSPASSLRGCLGVSCCSSRQIDRLETPACLCFRCFASVWQVNRQILKEEEEKAKIQKDLSILTDRLSKINESLARKVQARNEYDRTVQETEVRVTAAPYFASDLLSDLLPTCFHSADR